MRLHLVLEDLLGTPSRVRALRVLTRDDAGEWSGRELARAAGCSAPQTIQALRQLENLGMVTRKVVGRAHRWKLVTEHVLLEPLRSLFSFESSLPERFRDDLRRELREMPVQRAWIYGSLARASETNESDADLYLIRGQSVSEEELQRALTPVTRRFIRRYGTILSPLIHSEREATRPRNPGLVTTIRAEGVPIISGPG